MLPFSIVYTLLAHGNLLGNIFSSSKFHPLGGAPILRNVEACNRNDDPAGVRWINSDALIGFTYIMKNTREETDTT